MPMKRRRRQTQTQTRNRSMASRAKTKGSAGQHGENSPGGHVEGYSGPNLPKEIWWHIHSLMPMRDAASVACVSQDFEYSWRYHPNLTFSEETLGLKENVCGKDNKMRYFTNRVDKVMKKHTGIGVKTFKLEVGVVYNHKDSCHLDRIDSCLQIAVKPGIEELHPSLSPKNIYYNFPCTLLSGGTGDSLRCLTLVVCKFYPTESCCLRGLTKLKLYAVGISEDNLRCIFSNTCGLEWLELHQCNLTICIKIPCLPKLSYLGVTFCTRLQSVESKAPNLCSFRFAGERHVQLSLGDTLRIKEFNRSCTNAAFYARTELPCSMPNLETLTICSLGERLNTPMMPSRFLYLKSLSITLPGLSYDHFSLVSFFHASPSLETFNLCVLHNCIKHTSIFADPSGLRMMHDHHHDKLKSVQIISFCSAKSLVELTCHILKSATSLQRLTLNTTPGARRCSANKSSKCMLMHKDALVEARRAVLAVEIYIKPNAPSSVELNVLEPCSKCHAEHVSLS